ncbi:uncharacterized protein V6R79_021834 [Siganus canaliculatus]
MYFTTTVKTLVLLLLCLGHFDFTFSGRLRKFSVKEKQQSISECQQENQSLVTIYDEEDAVVFDSLTPFKIDFFRYGLGLRKKNTSSTWSDGTLYTYRNSTVKVSYWNQTCEAMDNDKWRGFNCSEKKFFMCKKDYTLIEEKMSWCKARQYCKNNNTDLVSISNHTENMQVIQNGKNSSFWIGLMHDRWEWQDKGCSSYRKWNTSSLKTNYIYNERNCTVLQPGSPLLMTFDCASDRYCIASSGTMRIIVIKEKSTWEQAFDYCNANHDGLLWIENEQDQEAVKQWLLHSNSTGTFWMGLRQSRLFGFWIWTSDHIVSYSNWTNGIQPELPLSKHCGVIKTDQNYTWQDESCLVPHYFLCEEEMIKLDESVDWNVASV